MGLNGQIRAAHNFESSVSKIVFLRLATSLTLSKACVNGSSSRTRAVLGSLERQNANKNLIMSMALHCWAASKSTLTGPAMSFALSSCRQKGCTTREVRRT